MKYIVDLPDAYTSKSALLGDILSIPICLEGGKGYEIPTGIKLEPYTETDQKTIKNNHIHLCGLCDYNYPDCPANESDVLFGDGVGNDNICCCNHYMPSLNLFEPDKEDIEDEVWSFAWKIANMDMFDYEKIYGITGCPHNYQDAKIQYEAWQKKQKEDNECFKEVTDLAEKMGIHRLYAIVKEIRGEEE